MGYLCHGKAVTKLHYRFRTDATVVAQYRAVDKVLATIVSLDEIQRRSRLYLPDCWDGK